MTNRHRPYHCHHCGHHGTCRHCRPPRGDSAGTAVIAFLVVLLIVGLCKPSATSPTAAPTNPVMPLLQTPEQVVEVPEDPAAEPEARPVGDDPAPPIPPLRGDEERETPELAGPAPEGCASARCQGEFARYSAAPAGKAFIVSVADQGFWAAGEDSVSEAIRRALELCAQTADGGNCRVALVAGR